MDIASVAGSALMISQAKVKETITISAMRNVAAAEQQVVELVEEESAPVPAPGRWRFSVYV